MPRLVSRIAALRPECASFARTAFLLIALLFLAAQPAVAAPPRILPAGEVPPDSRLADPKNLDGYFPLEVPRSAEAWEARREAVRRQILVSQGIWPLPTKTPLNAVIHGRIEQPDYTIDKVILETMPGLFLAGNLYRPKKPSAEKVPGVLVPHGHWDSGRFYDAGPQAVRREIVQGAERFEDGGRSPLQPLPVQVARMGCVAFHYDMLGYADSTQLSYELVHRFSKQRPEMNAADGWGFFSPRAEAHLQSVMGLQTWNSIRALDFLLSLPEIDAERIAVTGASGGGTQTFILGAIDPRVKLAFPAVMVSTAMQGGCTCENASCLRVGTGNVEFAGLFAPRPLGMTAANDWTREMATKGFPELKSLYKLLGAEGKVELFPFVHFGHNYNYVSRSAFYGFLNKHFRLGFEPPVVEEDYQRLTKDELTVWNAEHPQPAGGDDFEKKLLQTWHQDTQSQLAALALRDAESLAKWREVAGGGMAVVVGRGLPAAAEIEFEKSTEVDEGDYLRMAGLVHYVPGREVLPMAFLHPKKWNKRVVIWLSEQGKAGIFNAEGRPNPVVSELLAAGTSVVGVDLLLQGEFLTDGAPPARNRPVTNNNREFAGYTYGYNHALIARRAHDVLTTIAFCKYNDQGPEQIDLVALDSTGPIAALALSQAAGNIRRAAINTHGFRFADVPDYLDAHFLPGGAKYGDLPGFVALAAPTKLWLAGDTGESAPLIKQVYEAAGAADNLTWSGKDANVSAVVAWLKQP
jgi:hypothetical protein